ncbi:MAG TPA: D-alanyl-D-alanine carboxypeptidase family protein [Solirubrobacteraceae bacterium]|jgi:D-alanyl-D-alanine carboxypeptidase (penicillin-binding protein 5/6)|nr:D-alanyl-D-alanine carboxypeptidase family protein [Solirubrobacteraceae bacterium]
MSQAPRIVRWTPRALLLTLVVCGFVVVAAPVAAAQSGVPALQAKSAIVVEASTGDVLFSKNARQRRSIASATKLMTVLVALQHSDLDDILSAGSYPVAASESQIGLRPGERMSVRDLLRATLLPSANDAAAAIAAGTIGSTQAFVAEMNRRALALGLGDTHYTTPVGLDTLGNYSSARDLAKLAVRLRRYEFFRRTTDLPSATLRSGSRTRVVINRNTLVRRVPEVNGVKTGHTSRAGFVLVGSARRAGVTVISVVLGEPSERARDSDSLALLRYGLRAYRAATPLPEGRIVGRVALRYRGDDAVDVVAGASVRRVLRRDATTSVTVTGLPSEVDGPLPRGSRVGTATVRAGRKVLARVPVVTARPIAEAGLGTRLGDLVGRAQTIISLVLLLVCSLPLVMLRRRAMRRRQALDAEHRRTRRREETPV